ncbi:MULTISPECIES: CBM35 domain-containing protein [Streptomyces]|uniref:CBM35 domain-containing protein n=2 Tax=Streptomyces TaxID=1883 RepID=A0ABU7YKT5_9ACTN|nr:CBM35 domain-containing protein [Streptomyces roseolus]MDX2297980.1 CBM35 domain-containing protein [Streptomyces roseolus]MDX2298039.1 CBM35 domain-containing protein [Streptomyces roseolus]
MAAGNDGANKPEDDDPFGYLYADGQAAAGRAPQGGGYGYPGPAQAQPGVPRTSYNQVRTVGERQYGQQPAQPYVPPQQQAAYGQPHPQYAAPETYGGAQPPRHTPPPQGPRGGGRGPNTKGLLIGAVAVVAVVVAGITAAIIGNQSDKKDQTASTTPTASAPATPSQDPSSSQEPSTEPTEAPLPKQDAATLTLGGSATLAKDVKGAEGADGAYVAGFNAQGSSVTWKASMPEGGNYSLTVRYAIPAVDANATLTVNGKPNSQPIGLKNFIKSTDPNLEKNWQTTWAPVELQKGENEIKISCEAGNQCDVLLDWLEVTPPKAS